MINQAHVIQRKWTSAVTDSNIRKCHAPYPNRLRKSRSNSSFTTPANPTISHPIHRSKRPRSHLPPNHYENSPLPSPGRLYIRDQRRARVRKRRRARNTRSHQHLEGRSTRRKARINRELSHLWRPRSHSHRIPRQRNNVNRSHIPARTDQCQQRQGCQLLIQYRH